MSGNTKDLYDSLGALYLGATITMSLWGIATLQMYYYCNRFFMKDALWIKLLVLLIWALDTVHQALIVETGYESLTTNYADIPFLVQPSRILTITSVISFLVTGIVHLFLLFRIWILSKKNRKLSITVAMVITLEIMVSIFDLTKVLPMKRYSDIKPYVWLVKFLYSIIAATDISIAFTLAILLHRSRTGFEKSDSIINRLIVFTVNTGAIPSLFSLLVIVMIEVYPDNLIWISLYFFISKVYTNTLLATLNAREYNDEITGSTVFNSIPEIIKASNNEMPMTIRVDTITEHRTNYIIIEELKPETPELKGSVDIV